MNRAEAMDNFRDYYMDVHKKNYIHKLEERYRNQFHVRSAEFVDSFRRICKLANLTFNTRAAVLVMSNRPRTSLSAWPLRYQYSMHSACIGKLEMKQTEFPRPAIPDR